MPVFFHCRDRPAKSIINSSFFFFKFKPNKFRIKIPGRLIRQITGHMFCIRSHARCWGPGLLLGKKKPRIPAVTDLVVQCSILEISSSKRAYLWCKDSPLHSYDRLEKRSVHFGDIKVHLWIYTSCFFTPALKNLCCWVLDSILNRRLLRVTDKEIRLRVPLGIQQRPVELLSPPGLTASRR